MEKLTEFLQMGGFAAYIWPAYVFSALILGVVALWSIRERRKASHDYERLQALMGQSEP